MNEITKIHLGRQPFVIAVDAHKLLQQYLLEIKRQVGKNGGGVVDEVEMRIAELLAERGIKGDKVILADDIAYVKEQLGSPSDFKDDEADAEDEAKPGDDQAEPTRRLFRDTEHGMLAGVAAGIAAYFNIDVVIVRIIFAIAIVSGGWGIVVYIVMWLVIPEARTASERLQMRGKAVTVDSLKELVDRADVTGAATRASHSLVTVLSLFVKVILVIVGCALAAVAVGLLVLAAMAGVYALLHNGHIVHGAVTFPLGTTETVAAAGGLGVLTGIAAFLLATGVSMVRRKWSVPGWGVAGMTALLLISIVVCGAAVPDTVQNVRARYESNSHTETRTLAPYKQVDIVQGNSSITVEHVYDGSYKVELRYLDSADTAGIKTTVHDDTLTVDTRNFKPGADWDCDGLCIGARDYFRIVVHEPASVQPAPLELPEPSADRSPVKPLP